MSLKISSLLTEYEDHPIGLDEKAPRFSWTLQSEENNTIQSGLSDTGDRGWKSGMGYRKKKHPGIYRNSLYR